MREIWDPTEAFGSTARALQFGWLGTFTTTAGGRTDISGNGGRFYMTFNNSTTTSPAIVDGLNHYHIKFGFWQRSNSRFGGANSAGTVLWNCRQINDGTFTLYNGSGTGSPLETSAYRFPNDVAWVLVEIECYHHATNGFVKIWADGVQIINYSGAFVSSDKFFRLYFGQLSGPRFDDIGCNSVTIRYDGGTGSAPLAGETITGGTSGATAVITAVRAGSDATSGTLVLENWDSTAFQDNEALTSASLTALVDAPNAAFVDGLEPNSKRLGNEFIGSSLPNGAGTTTQLTPSTGSNWQNVDDMPAVDSNYNNATALNQMDTYVLDASTEIPTYAEITAVATAVRAQSSLTGIDGYEHVLRVSGTDYFSDRLALASSWDGDVLGWALNPATGAGWTRAALVAGLNNFEAGVRMIA